MFNDWDKLLYLIQQGECVLFLGPELPVLTGEGERFSPTEDLAERIHSRIARAGDDADGPRPTLGSGALQLLQAEDGGEVALEMVVKEWHGHLGGRRSVLHDLLGELPFKVIVASGHDPLMENALKAAKKDPQTLCYNYQGDFQELGPEVSENEPLLFHLFGHVSEPESLVLTEMQVLEFLTNLISKTPALPNDVNQVLANSRTFLFLGFGLRHWYLRILLHHLKILKKVDKQKNRAFAVAVESARDEAAPPGQAVVFYQKNYRFEVLEQDVLDFVTELSDRYVPPASGESHPATEKNASNGRVHRPDVPTVFICHASENADVAARLYRSFEAANLNPWLDKESLRGGDRWDDLIETTIDEVDYFVILHSRELADKANERSYVNKEIKLALDAESLHGLKRFIIPARMDETAPDPRFKGLHFVDLMAGGGDKDLVRAIKRDG